jgi:HEAT repeat protein
MGMIKTAALTFIAIVACLILLLIPDSYRDGAPISGMLPARQKIPPINQQQPSFRFEREQPATLESDRALAVAQDKPESIATQTAAQSVDWPQILYPELARIQALEHQPADTAFSELLPMLSNDDPVIRLAAIDALGDMTNQSVLSALSSALNDPDPQLRIAALEALASQEDELVVSSIEPYLYDHDQDVRLAAIEALVELESETAVYALAGLLSDQDGLIRHQAVNALGDIGGKNAISYLLQARYDPDETIRANADAILAEEEFKANY